MTFKSKKNNTRDIDISLTPLIDLFLNILVFFLVSTTFQKNQWISLNVPKTISGAAADKDTVVALSIDPQGKIFYNKNETNLVDLIQTLKQENNKQIPVIIAADEKVVYGKVMQVLDEVKLTGLNNISVLSRN